MNPLISAVLLLALGGLGRADQRPARPPLLTWLLVGTHRIPFVNETVLEHGHRVPIAAANFDSVRRVLGPAATTDTGDAGGANTFACYRLAGRPAMSLILESSEMGGGTWLTGFTFVPTGSRPDLERRCATSNIDAHAVSTDLGLRLGLTRDQVNRRLQAVGRDSAGSVVYERDRQRPFINPRGQRDTYQEAAGFTVTMVAGRVAAFDGWRIDSW
jgi:hypothetical protein